MNKKIKKLYKAALKNEYFLNAIKEADNIKCVGEFPTKKEKVLLASIYFGWLVGKYDNEWESYIRYSENKCRVTRAISIFYNIFKITPM